MCAEESRSIVLPTVLYKYRSWDCCLHREALRSNTVYFASPSKFNDPFDCMIPPDFCRLPGDALVGKAFEVLVRESSNADDTIRELADSALRELAESPDPAAHLRAILKDVTYEGTEKLLTAWIGVLSLTAVCDDILMWAHYANSHRGFCIGYSTESLFRAFERFRRNGSPTIMPGVVRYQSSYPTIDPADTSDWNWVLDRYAVKARNWKYEQEVRLISLPRSNFSVPVGPETVAEVIVGHWMAEQDVGALKQCLTNAGANPSFYRARVKNRQFGLDIIPL